MKFGVFDHMDDAGIPLGQLYADRLQLVEAYDRAGLRGYHLAEHHSTPLGCAASPGLFLAAAAQHVTIVTIALRPTVRVITDRYRAVRANLGKAPMGGPLLGVARHVVLADTDEAALEIARRAYPRWRDSFRWLFARHGAEPRIAGLYPPTFDELAALDNGVAGSPRTVRDFVAAELEASGSNYLLSWFAFGDMTLSESLRSVELFSRDVMPAFANARADAAE